MFDELDDFLQRCGVERRLAPLTCSAYERDVRARLNFVEREGLGSLGDVRTPHCAASSLSRSSGGPRRSVRRALSRVHVDKLQNSYYTVLVWKGTA